jgi:phage terminase Nu1 subunit (DNA packaging protein)
MHIPLPNGDVLIPRAEFAALLDVTPRTISEYEKQGCPGALVGGVAYNPQNEGLNWVASLIRRRNPPRARSRKAAPEARATR